MVSSPTEAVYALFWRKIAVLFMQYDHFHAGALLRLMIVTITDLRISLKAY